MEYRTFSFPVACAVVGIVAASLYLDGCNASDGRMEQNSLNVNVVEPVDRDLEAIKKRGVLRMITRYSSNTYFLHQGVEWGFEYELVRRFAEEHNLALEVVITGINKNPYDLLNSGKGDLIAGNYTTTPERKKYVDFTHPYNLVDQVVVYSDEIDNPPQSVDELASSGIPVTVRSNSSYYHRIQDLWEDSTNVSVNLVSNQKDTESLLFDVSQGKYRATIADDNIFQASAKYMEGLIQGPTTARNDTIAWAIRKNAPELKQEMDRFLADHFQFQAKGQKPKRSLFLDVLRQRYFEGGQQVAEYYSPSPDMEESGSLSPYDELIETVADSAGMDRLMITSLIAQETKFDPLAKSWAGAVGLMQILPRYSEVADTTKLYNEEINLREGMRILKNHLEHYSYIDSTDRWSFALAAYNAGEGHMADARRLVIDQNKDPNEWANVSDALLKLMHRSYYRNARHGFCRGIETVRYVREIKNRYEVYQNILAMKEYNQDEGLPGVLGFFN
jgi:membrane-bound lytic murein transglycosylase F